MAAKEPFEWKGAVLDAFRVNEEMNQLLVRNIDNRAWRAVPPGYRDKTIAGLFSHIHNCRLMWLKTSTGKTPRTAKLNRRTVTKQKASAALRKSAEEILRLLEAGLAREDGRVRDFPLPNAVGALCYMVEHDAHHRGQVLMVHRQLGYRLPPEVAYGIWHWRKLKKQVAGGG